MEITKTNQNTETEMAKEDKQRVFDKIVELTEDGTWGSETAIHFLRWMKTVSGECVLAFLGLK